MFVKKFKRKCDVRGCKNTANVYLISKRREMGNTIAICTECLKDAQASIDGYVEEKKAIKVARPLFPHPELEVTLSSVTDEEPELVEVIDEVAEDTHIVAEDTVTIDEILEAMPKEMPKKASTPKKKSNKKK